MPPWCSGDNMSTLSLDDKIEARKKERRRGRKHAQEKHGGDNSNVVDLPSESTESWSHEADAIKSSELDDKIEARKKERRRGRKHAQEKQGDNVADLPSESTESGPHVADAIKSSELDDKIEARIKERRRGRKHAKEKQGGDNVVDLPSESTESGSHLELDKRIEDKLKARRRKERPQRTGEAETKECEIIGKGTQPVVTYELKHVSSPDGSEELLSAIVEGSEYSGSNAFSGVPSSRGGPSRVTKNGSRAPRICDSDDAQEIAADSPIEQDRIRLARQKSLEAKMPLDLFLKKDEMNEPGVGRYKKTKARRLSIEQKLPFDISIERETDESSDTNERPITTSVETESATESVGQASTSTANSSRVTAGKSDRPSLQSSDSSRLLDPPTSEPDSAPGDVSADRYVTTRTSQRSRSSAMHTDSSSESFFSEEDIEDEDIAYVSPPNSRTVGDFSESSEESSYDGSNPSSGTMDMAASHLGSLTNSNISLLSLSDDDDVSIAEDRSRDGDEGTRKSDFIWNGEHTGVSNDRTMGMLVGKRDAGIQRYIQSRMNIADSVSDDSMSSFDEVADSDSGDSVSSNDEDTPLNSRSKSTNIPQLDGEHVDRRERSDVKQRKSVTFGQSETLFDQPPGSLDIDLDHPNQPDTELSSDLDPPIQSPPRNSSSTLRNEDEIQIPEKDSERDRKFEEFYEKQIFRASQENDAPSDIESRTESLISEDIDISISEDSSSDASSSEGETGSESSKDDSSSSSEDDEDEEEESESDEISSSAELDEKYMSLLSNQFTSSKGIADDSLRSGKGSRKADLDSSANRVRLPDDPRYWSKSVQGSQQEELLLRSKGLTLGDNLRRVRDQAKLGTLSDSKRSIISLKSNASVSATDRKFRRSQFSQNTTHTGSTSKSNNTAKTHGSSETIKMQSNLLDESNCSRRSRRSDMSGLSASDFDRQGLPSGRIHGGSSSSQHGSNSVNHETSSRRSRQGSTSSSRRSHNSASSRRSGDSRGSPTRRQDGNDSIHSMGSGNRLKLSSRSHDSSQPRSPERKGSTRSDSIDRDGHTESLQNLALNDSLREAYYMGSTVQGASSELPVTRRMSNSSDNISYPVVKGTAVAIVGDDEANIKPKRAKKLFKMLSIHSMESNGESRGLSRRTLFGRRNKSSHQFNQSDGNILANDFNDSFSSVVGAALDRSVSKMSFSRRRPLVEKRRPSVDNPIDTSIASFISLPNNSRQSLIAQQQALKMRQDSLAREINAFNALIDPQVSRGDSFAENATFHKSTSDVGWQEVSQSSHGRSADTITSLLEPTQLPHTSPALRRYKSQTIRDRNNALVDRRASFDEISHGNPSSEPLKNSTSSSSESFHRREVSEVAGVAQQLGHVAHAGAVFEPNSLPLQLQLMGAILAIGFTSPWAASRVLEAPGPTRINARGPTANSIRVLEEIQCPVAAGATIKAACLDHPTPRGVRSRVPPRSTATLAKILASRGAI
ncbi:hypothetical protein THAOC_02818 [Thalassiosira oceanica]|uniref:Uncharacterized protein n=1 Tax=Thalassiosira oceanica TaxID=159749 RepID=K0TLN1_THAOC|nr:hypothetical protein THAOC_02818 [Thalassiosira oceanica]|eukprot:EJK75456.1 hypothetical protein THAOC_02818 [Thalassiosira oceanica]